MSNGTKRFYGALLTVLVILSVISIKMAFIYTAEFLLVLLVTVPAVTILYIEKLNDGNNEKLK
jgi:hypothetical protein